MKKIKKTALDLLDDIYSLAYWMTGSEEVSHDLVYCTYLSANSEARGERVTENIQGVLCGPVRTKGRFLYKRKDLQE